MARRRAGLGLFAPLALSLAVFARGAPAQDAALERALDTIRAERITADVAYVSCDEMGGRDTPSLGQRLTARFLRNRLQRIGWRPGAGRPGARDPWFFTYPLSYRRMKEPETRAQITRGDQKVALSVGSDYFFPARELDNAEYTGGVVFCGRGSTEEFAAAGNLRGRWALCQELGDSLRSAEERAQPTGAVGLLAIAAPESSAPAYADQYGRVVTFLRTGRVQPVEPAREAKGKTLPRAYLAASAAERLFRLAGTSEPAVGQDLGVVFTDTRRLVGDGTIECENVVGFWPGSDPKLAREVLLVSAHYDHLGTTADGIVYNGADDNGSGTCGLLALAEALVVNGPLRRSVMLIWVSGEEKGLLGSEAWARAPFFPNDGKAVANLNLDMIGRNARNQLLLTPTQAHPAHNGIVKLAEKLAPLEGFTDLQNADEYYTRSDQAMFAKLGIPVLFLFGNVHEDYHKPSDKVEKLDGDKARRVVRLVLRMLDAMQGDLQELDR
ncbi:MAG TPA: M28 family peptidase [Planctomycetota bacterium]|nr:M28 family peptidase [Planctomycetota bacterium]